MNCKSPVDDYEWIKKQMREPFYNQDIKYEGKVYNFKWPCINGILATVDGEKRRIPHLEADKIIKTWKVK